MMATLEMPDLMPASSAAPVTAWEEGAAADGLYVDAPPARDGDEPCAMCELGTP